MNEHHYSFSEWNNYQASLVFAFDQPTPKHSHHHHSERRNHLSAWLVRKGWATLESDGESATAHPGQWLICTGKQVFQQMAEETHLLSLRIEVRWPYSATFLEGNTLAVLDANAFPSLQTRALDLLKFYPRLDLAHPIPPQIIRTSRLSYRDYLHYRENFERWMIELVDSLKAHGCQFGERNPLDPRLREAVSLLEHHPLSEPFPRNALERISGVQLHRLNQLCTEALGTTMLQYWEERRNLAARRALSLDYLTPKEIASSLGFTQLSHFSRWFRSHNGEAPRQFRQRVSRELGTA